MQRIELDRAIVLRVTEDNSPVILMKEGEPQIARKYFINADGSPERKACQLGNCLKCGSEFEGDCWYSLENQDMERGWFIDSDKPIADIMIERGAGDV